MKSLKFTLTLLLITLLATSIFAQQIPKKYVVVEIATGTWCTYCPGSAMGADDLVENGHSVAIIENHGGDSYQNVYSTARNNLYNPSGYPTAYFNGRNAVVGGSHTETMYPSYLPKYNAEISVSTSFDLDLSYTNTGSEYDVTVALNKVADYSGTNLKLFLVLTESKIEEEWQDYSGLNFVNRRIYPDQNGIVLDFSTETSQTFNYNFTVDPLFNLANCELVAFVQDYTSKEILQADKEILQADAVGANNVGIFANEIPDNCSNVINPSFIVKNFGTSDVTEMIIEYDVNGEGVQYYTWTGTPIAFNTTQEIILPETSFSLLEINTLTINITSVNTLEDDFPTNNISNLSFNKAPEVGSKLFLTLNTDNYGSECFWNIKDNAGNTVANGGPYGNNQTIEVSITAQPDCYTFNLIDTYGDGGGSVILQDGASNIIYSTGGNYGTGYSQAFSTFATAPNVSISPENGATDILAESPIVFTFDEKIRLLNDSPVTTPADLFTLTDASSNNVDFTAEINLENTIITITPVTALNYEEQYTVTLTSGLLENEYDIALEGDHFSTFTVQAEPANAVKKIDASQINVFPNPAVDKLNVDIYLNSNADIDVNITDILGKKVYFKSFGNLSSGNHKLIIDEINLKSGFYYLNINNDGNIVTKKISINN